MNLMDMLSVDPPSSIYGGEIDQPSIYEEGEAAATATAAALDRGIVPQQNLNVVNNNAWDVASSKRNADTSGIYYIPTSLTETQIVLIQILLHLISETLINEVKLRRKKTSIDSLLEVSSMSTQVAASGDNDSGVNSRVKNVQLIFMCFDNLLTINNHPSLLVNHFMPKRLLLSQPTSSQALMSGKLQFFNKLIDSVLEKSRLSHNEHYPILVVARNNKELELIEGLIIGKELRYTNSGNLKLYDDKRPVNEEEGEGAKKGVFLNLIQTQQLYNNYMNKPTSSSYRFIFSFDSKIDSTNPSIEMLRSKHACPIFVPIPIYSIEHLMLQMPEPSSGGFDMDIDVVNDADAVASLTNPKQMWKLKLLNTLAVNFTKFNHALHNGWQSRFYYDTYGIKMKFFHENIMHPQRIDDLFTTFNDELVLHYSDDRLLKKLNTIYGKQIFGAMELGQPLTVDNFKYQFAELLAFKLREMNLEMDEVQGEGNKEQKGDSEEGIGQKRLITTSKQVHFDEDENTIAESYHKLRKLNDDANIVDRKLARVENDLHKFSEKDAELENKLSQLKSITEHSVSQSLLTTQSTQLENLRKELTDLQQEYDRLTNETEDLRIKYQQSSSEAVIESQKQQKLQLQLEKITNKMQSPGMALLPDLIYKDTLLTNQHRLDKLRHQNKFLESFYHDQIEKVLVERQSIIESSGGASVGSSSRPSNRISRDSTPF
ncbi:Hda2 protein [Candida orthopsilosis Co 90-125]|uniref:Hda2 protein n=1 Tax=Candida orthopsilosis (strain 90-125) TaxID=1136231 RepID=H8X2P9_CANO9|nr:Hda2 protein [Candida orthopsilosis Co 90-125]CCG25596.1 Hda2 protein [Candida orthopsilosis Co 90-125]